MGEAPFSEVGGEACDSTTISTIKGRYDYLHNDRPFKLDDTIEFFNLNLKLKLTVDEKDDLVAFLRVL